MVKEGWLTRSQRADTRFPAIGKPRPTASKAGQRGYIVEAVNDYLTSHHIVDPDDLRRGGYRIVTTIQKGKEDAFVAAAQADIYDRLGDDPADAYVRAGGASIDPATGQVVALYGGIDYTKQYVSSATNATYPPGSTFKPVILASALDNGSKTQDGEPITPATVYDGTDKREVVGPDGPTGYRPGNEDGGSFPSIDVTSAMDRSVNTVYAQMAQDVGTSKVIDTAHDLGLPDSVKIPTTPAMALGSFGASPLQMAQVYATLANHGTLVPYTLVLKVSKDGNDVSLPDRDPSQAVPSKVADTVTQVLRSVVDSPHGTATVAQRSGRPAAAKTGTADKDIAAWFAGFTPRLATVVDVIGMDPEKGGQKPLYHAMNLPRINGGGPPGQVWADYTAKALHDVPVKGFDLDVSQDLPPAPTTTDEPGAQDTAPPEPQDTTPPPSTAPATGSPTTEPPATPPADPTTPTPADPLPTETLDPLGGLTGGTRPSGGTDGGVVTEPGPRAPGGG
jgi:membrane peptidoglycan carboxypeptidase